MKKKLGIWLITVLLFIQPVIPAHAAPDENTVIESVSGYCLGDELYTFLRINDGYDVSGFKVSLQSDEISAVNEELMLPITETSSIVHYVFMVDLTGSMRKYVEEVNEFVNALTEAEKQEVFYTVATFGERFQIVRENLTDKNAVTNVISGLEYTEQLTDPYTGIESALVYLDNYSRRSGDLVNLIVITDGDPDLGIADEEQSKKKEESLAESAEIKIAHTPEVVVSTLCTNEWDKLAYETVSKGKGIHEVIHGNKEASAAGKKLAGYVDGLYRNSFQLSKTPNEERFAMELKIKGNNQEGQLAFFSVSMENVADLKAFSNDGEPEENTLIIDENAPEVKEESSEDNLTDTQEDSEMEEDVVTELETESETLPEEADEQICFNMAILIGIPIVGVMVLVIVLVIARRKKSNNAAAVNNVGNTGAAGNGIAMRLEVYEGSCKSKTDIFYLVDSVTIGSASNCDIIFNDAQVAPLNSRIFVRNQMIYIEDMNSPQGTAIGGMRIQGQNRLRSGDVISIGTVEFSFKF